MTDCLFHQRKRYLSANFWNSGVQTTPIDCRKCENINVTIFEAYELEYIVWSFFETLKKHNDCTAP